jgi:hypothetical protein
MFVLYILLVFICVNLFRKNRDLWTDLKYLMPPFANFGHVKFRG